jgi:PilZ domain
MTERQTLATTTSSRDNDDRRRAPRHDATHLGSVITRVIGGGEVKLLDFSRSGVLIESDTRLAIGAKATIRLTTTDASLTVRGQVVRSKVAGLNGTLVYHTALQLEDDLTVLEKNVPAPPPPAPQDDTQNTQKSEKGAHPLMLNLSSDPPPDALHDADHDPDHEGGHLDHDLAESLAAVRGSGSEHAYLDDLDTGVGAPVDPILEFLATVPLDLAELRRRAAVNNW